MWSDRKLHCGLSTLPGYSSTVNHVFYISHPPPSTCCCNPLNIYPWALRHAGKLEVSNTLITLITLQVLFRSVEGISTLIPGRISSTRSKVEHFECRVTTPLINSAAGGFKLIAREASSVQEVFCVTNLSKESLEEAIFSSLPRNKQFRRLQRKTNAKTSLDDDKL